MRQFSRCRFHRARPQPPAGRGRYAQGQLAPGGRRLGRPGALAFVMAAVLALLAVGACSKPDAAQGAAPAGPSAASAASASSASPSATPSSGASAGDSATASAPLSDGPATASASAGPAPLSSLPRTRPTASAGSTAPNEPAGTAAPSGGALLAPPEPSVAVLEPAAPGSADELAQQVDDIYQPIQRFAARFEQSYQAKVAGVTKKSKGTLVVERPARLSFRYEPPNNNRVVSDGITVRVYEAENNQLLEQPVARTEYPGALAFLMGHGLRPSFTFSFNDKAKFEGGRVLVGKPRSANPAYEQVLFYVDQAQLAKRSPGTIRRVVVLDAQQNRNRFDFLEASTPDKVDPSEFLFTPPAGVTVVK
jgi:outer membrane lipoprotein-sorting protein